MAGEGSGRVGAGCDAPNHATVAAIEALKEEGRVICGVVSVLDRLAGGGPAIEAAAGAPYRALTTIDEIYPDRPS